jgi:hypothetical protein
MKKFAILTIIVQNELFSGQNNTINHGKTVVVGLYSTQHLTTYLYRPNDASDASRPMCLKQKFKKKTQI